MALSMKTLYKKININHILHIYTSTYIDKNNIYIYILKVPISSIFYILF